MNSSTPANYPWGSASSSRMPPVNFWPPLSVPVLSLHVCAHLPVPCGPPAKGPACSGRDLPSQWTAVGLSTLQLGGPHSLLAAIYSLVWVLSTSTFRAQGCCFRKWRGRPFWWASQCSACFRPPPRFSPHGPWLPSLCPCPDYNMPSPPCPLQLLTVYWMHLEVVGNIFGLHLLGIGDPMGKVQTLTE